MIVYYARGGGFGHVTRARRVLAALGVEGEIVTRLPETIEGRLIVDAFPGGLEGELCGLDVPMDYVARLLRWNEYRRAVPGKLPRFGTTWIVEELTPDHRAFVSAHSDRVEFLDLSEVVLRESVLRSPKDDLENGDTQNGDTENGDTENGEPYCLVVHSGPEHEVRELVAYAAELDPKARIVVASPYAVEGYPQVDACPVSHLFPAAAHIVSAAGFNVMLETEPWRDKHLVVPFPRKFDEQFLRAARRKATTSSPRPRHPRRTDTSGAAR